MKGRSFCGFRLVGIVVLTFIAGRSGMAAKFSTAPYYMTGTGPTSVAVGDLNGDKKLDLVVADGGSNDVAVLLGNGDGTFPPQAVTYSAGAGTGPSSVALADFNRDGKLDIVLANATSNNISVLLGNGDGTFQAAVCYAAGNKPSSVAVGDFNGDQITDVVVANQSDNDVSVLLGTGSGSFQTAVTYKVGTAPTSVVVADFNSDRKLDLAVANGGSNNLSILLGRGDGTFSTIQQHPGGWSGSEPVSLAVGDFNGDGKPDLAVATNVDIWVTVLLGQGDGTFKLTQQGSHEAGTSPTGVAVGDFNGDGKLDLAVSNNGSNTLTILPGIGDGTLSWIGNFDAHAGCIAVAVGDFNADGIPDAVVVNGIGNSVSVLLGNGDGTVVAPVSYGIGGSPEAVAASAFVMKGTPDLVASNGVSGPGCMPGCISVLTAKGDGSFNQYAINYEVDSNPRVVISGDFNLDGNPDVAVANSGSGDVSVLLNNGLGGFDPSVPYPAGTTPIALTVGDFNNDSKPDLAVVNADSGDVSILLGMGDGTFGSALDPLVGTSPTAAAVGDFNGDGNLDLAVTNGGSNSVSVLLGYGDGTFQAATSYAVGIDPTSLAIGDLNGDGILDLAVASVGVPPGMGTLTTLLGNGDGTFKLPTSLQVGVDLLSIALADFDGDGKLDVVVVSGGSVGADSGATVLKGNGDGTFKRPPENYNFGNIADSVAVADLNGDGAPDLAVTSKNAGVTVLLNPGGTFMTASSSLNPSAPGQTVTFTAAVAASVKTLGQAAPSGTVLFDDGQTAIGSGSLVSGTASFSTSTLSAGSHTITAVYTGDTNFNPNVAPPITQTVSGPDASLSATSLVFKTQLVGTSSAAKPVTLTNTGSATLDLTSITIAGANPADFSQTNNCGSSVAAGASCTINVTFKPQAQGTRTASITITDNALGSPQTVSLTGTGTVVRLLPASLSFGSVQVGHTSATRTVTVTNTGTALLNISKIGITGANAPDFAETTTCGPTLGAGASCSIGVTFTPSTKGSRTAQLSISDTGGGGSQNVGLLGTGL